MSGRHFRLRPAWAGDTLLAALFACTAALGLLAPLLGESAPPARYLLVAGGSRPAQNQVSLEEHVQLLRRTLEGGPADEAHRPAGDGSAAAADASMSGSLLFAAGSGPYPVVQVEDERPPGKDLRSLLAELFGQTPAGVVYRPARLARVDGAADRQSFLAALQREARQAGPGGTLLLYFTGHGSVEAEPYGPTFWLWGDQLLGLKELAAALDELTDPPQLVLTFTQCFAGSFAPVLYRGGDPAQGPSPATRCGFFATLGDREATGCTPSRAVEGYDDYTVRLVEALRGRTLDGRAVHGPLDLDGDGRVGLHEAHAYVRLQERSVDVPTSTAELWLRERAPLPGESLHLGSPLPRVLAAARPTERTVLAGLVARLLPDDPSPVLQARYRSELLDHQVKALDRQYEEALQEREAYASQLIVELSARWPILEEPWHPDLPALLAEQGGQIERFLRPHPARRAMRRAQARADRLDGQRWKKLEERAWYDRLVRAAENVVLEAGLRSLGGKDVTVLDRLLACESWSPPGKSSEPVPVGQPLPVAGKQER
ncbi:MAG: hypothetical protein FJ125_00505 [Deltaproteobacteria bacterium]|nr:hypothetical protein [Deltaproteobacteria bacterium]